MKKLIIRLIVCAIALTWYQATAAQQWKTLAKKEYKIQAPSDWMIDSSGQMNTNLILFSMLENASDNFRENVNVMIQPLTAAITDLDKFTALSVNQIKTMAQDSKIESSTRIKTASAVYQKIIYTATQGMRLKFEQYYFVANKKAYVITFTADITKFDLYKPTAEQILNSFALK